MILTSILKVPLTLAAVAMVRIHLEEGEGGLFVVPTSSAAGPGFQSVYPQFEGGQTRTTRRVSALLSNWPLQG